MYKKFWIRIVDFTLALIAAVLLLPIHLLISYGDLNVSNKVVAIIQSYTGVIDRMVWRKLLN